MTKQLGWIRNLQFHTTRTPVAFAVACTLGLMAPSAIATPEGGTFITNPTWGQILQSGPAGQTVTNVFLPGANIDPSNRHIINWTSLDLGTQETLNFSGANGYSVMNRISGLGTATSINGTLNAMSGNVFIVNSAGVVFGQNAMINASGLHAAAANWSNGDAMQMEFLAGAPLTFNTTGDVEFGGTLNASNGVALLGQHVRNTGDISGRYVVMAAGDSIVVEDLGSRFSVTIDGQLMDDLVNAPVAGAVNADITTGDPGVHNSGTVTATDNGSVSLLVGDLLGLAILHDGEIHASGGDVDLLAAGGAIWTSTNNVEVAEAGLINVSDNTQAGTIDISATAIVLGGSTEANGHAGDISIQGYSNVIMLNGGAAVADGGATTADGGTILLRATDGTVWAESDTGLSAKGGLFGGDGGRIEVDGQSVALQAATKLGAVSGESGHLVINSNGPVVIDATGDTLVAVDETNLSTSILAIGEVGQISAATGDSLSSVDGHLSVTSTNPLRIETSLLGLRETASFTSSEIQVAIADADQRIDATTLSFSGDMSLESSVTLSGDDALALMDGNVSGDSTTAITLLSGGSMELDGDLGAADSKLASVYMETGHTLTMVGGRGRAGQYIHASGDVHIGGSNAGPVAITASEALVVQADGDISIGAVGGELDVTANNNVDVEAGGTLTNRAKFDVGGSLRFAGGDVHNAGGVSTEQGITMQALTGELHTEGALDTVMDINLASASTLTNDVSMTSEQGSIRLESYQSDVVSLASFSAADLVLLQADNGAVFSMADVQATDVTISAGSGVEISGNVEAASSFNAIASVGDIAVSGDTIEGDTLSLKALAGSIEATNSFVGQSVDIAAANNLTITGDVTAATSALTGAGGDVTLTAGTGPLVVTGDLAGTTILLTSTTGEIDATGNMTATTIGFDAGTDLTLAGDITSVDTLTLNATDAVNYSGNATSQGDVILTGQSITMHSGSLNGTAVEVTSPGAVVLAGEINTAGDLKVTSTSGTVALDVAAAIDGDILVNAEHDIAIAGELSASAISASSIQGDVTQGGSMVAAGEITVNASAGSVTLAGDLTGGDVFLDAASVQLSDGSIQSTVGDIAVLSDDLSVSGTVLLESAADLMLAADQGTGRMRVDGANLRMVAAGDLSLLATIDGADGVLNASTGDTLFLGGNVGSDEAVESLNLTGGALVLGGPRDGVMWDLSEVNARGNIGLNTSDLSMLSGLPSIYGFGPSLSVRSAEGNITFGDNHGFSYLGDVVLDAAGTLAIGDFTTLGDMTLRGEAIEVYRRSPTMLMSPDGSIESMQTSVVSGGLMTIDGDVQFVGSTGNNPLFGSVEGGSGIPGLSRAPVDPFSNSELGIDVGGTSRPTLKSLAAIVPPGDDDTIAAESQLGEIVVQLSGNEDIRTLAVLADLGIDLIDAAEVAQPTHHMTAVAEFVDDMGDRGSTMVDPTSGLVKITRSRLKDRFVRAAVADYAAALDAATEAGSLESAGLTVREARLEWEAQPGEKTDYRQWLAEGGDPIRERAARILADLDAVYRDLRLAGLTRAEVAASRRFVSAKLAG